MSDAKTIGIKDRMAARRTGSRIVTKEIPGLGTAKVRRVTAGDAVDFPTGIAAVVHALLDEQGNPLYASEAEARREDWGVMRKMLAAYDEVNSLDALVESAAKN